VVVVGVLRVEAPPCGWPAWSVADQAGQFPCGQVRIVTAACPTGLLASEVLVRRPPKGGGCHAPDAVASPEKPPHARGTTAARGAWQEGSKSERSATAARWRMRQAIPRAETVTCRTVPHPRVTHGSSPLGGCSRSRRPRRAGAGVPPTSARRASDERFVTCERVTNGSSQVGVPNGSSQEPKQNTSPSDHHSSTC